MIKHNLPTPGLALAALVLFLPLILEATCLVAQSPTETEAESLTLDSALEFAMSHAPGLRRSEVDLDLAEIHLSGARVFPFNPELELEPARRRSGNLRSTDFRVELSQDLEIAGQRGKRVDGKLAARDAATYRHQRHLQQVAAEVETAFARATEARETLRVLEMDAEVTRELSRYAERRLEAGAGNQIDLNLARAAAGRSSRALRLKEADYRRAQASLAEVIGFRDSALVEPDGPMPPVDAPLPPLIELVSLARNERLDLRSLEMLEGKIEAETRLQKSLAIPNLKVGAFYEEEGQFDDVMGVRIGFAIPVLNRNRAQIAESRALGEQLAARIEELEFQIRREVSAAFFAYQASALAASELEVEALGTLEENLDLVQKALEAGKLNSTDSLLSSRELALARKEYILTLADAWLARIELELATGQTEMPERP